MQTLKKFYFGKQKIKANTFIGGVSATINTPSLIATKLGVSVARIKAFKIVGANIEFAVIGGTYSVPANAFNGTTDLTYYNDADGLVTSVNQGSFVGATGSTYYIFPNLTTINSGTSVGTGAFQNNTSLSSFVAPKLATITGNYTFNTTGTTATNITSLNFPLLTGSLGVSTFNNQGKLITLTIGVITSIGVGCFSSCLKLKAFNCSYLTDVPNTAFDGCAELDNITNLNSALAVGQDSFRNCWMLPDFSANSLVTLGLRSFFATRAVRNYNFPSLTTINCGTGIGQGTFQNAWDILTFNAPNLTTINGNNCFNGWDKVTSISMPSLTQLGSTVGNDGHFGNLKTGCSITVKSSLQTINTGAPDGDLVYAVGTRSAVVTYV
jgi:hypothetical protein